MQEQGYFAMCKQGEGAPSSSSSSSDSAFAAACLGAAFSFLGAACVSGHHAEWNVVYAVALTCKRETATRSKLARQISRVCSAVPSHHRDGNLTQHDYDVQTQPGGGGLPIHLGAEMLP